MYSLNHVTQVLGVKKLYLTNRLPAALISEVTKRGIYGGVSRDRPGQMEVILAVPFKDDITYISDVVSKVDYVVKDKDYPLEYEDPRDTLMINTKFELDMTVTSWCYEETKNKCRAQLEHEDLKKDLQRNRSREDERLMLLPIKDDGSPRCKHGMYALRMEDNNRLRLCFSSDFPSCNPVPFGTQTLSRLYGPTAYKFKISHKKRQKMLHWIGRAALNIFAYTRSDKPYVMHVDTDGHLYIGTHVYSKDEFVVLSVVENGDNQLMPNLQDRKSFPDLYKTMEEMFNASPNDY